MGKAEREARATQTRAVWLGALAAADLRAENFSHPAQFVQGVISTALEALVGNGIVTIAPHEDWPTTFITVPPYFAPEVVLTSEPHLDEVVAQAEGKAFRQLTPEDPELPHGSIVMLQSPTGTAAQRWYADGSWHSSTGETYETWADLFRRRDGLERKVFLVYVAPREG